MLKEALIPFQEESLSAELSYFYPKLQVVGLDIAGELFTVGYWMEAAYFKPEDVKGSIVLSDNSGGSMIQEVQLFENYYLKYTVGIDYTFGIGEGLYVNFQYNHGFYDKIDYHDEPEEILGLGQPGLMSELEDYFAGDIKYTLTRWDLTLELFFLLEVADFDDFKNKFTLAIFPSISFKPTDGTNIEGGTIIGKTRGAYFKQKIGKYR